MTPEPRNPACTQGHIPDRAAGNGNQVAQLIICRRLRRLLISRDASSGSQATMATDFKRCRFRVARVALPIDHCRLQLFKARIVRCCPHVSKHSAVAPSGRLPGHDKEPQPSASLGRGQRILPGLKVTGASRNKDSHLQGERIRPEDDHPRHTNYNQLYLQCAPCAQPHLPEEYLDNWASLLPKQVFASGLLPLHAGARHLSQRAPDTQFNTAKQHGGLRK